MAKLILDPLSKLYHFCKADFPIQSEYELFLKFKDVKSIKNWERWFFPLVFKSSIIILNPFVLAFFYNIVFSGIFIGMSVLLSKFYSDELYAYLILVVFFYFLFVLLIRKGCRRMQAEAMNYLNAFRTIVDKLIDGK